MKKIMSGKNITIIKDGKPHMFMCGSESNEYLYNFLSLCEDAKMLDRAISDPSIQSYIKTYNKFPENNTEIFEHGHEISYIASDHKHSTKIEVDGNIVDTTLITFSNIHDITIPLSTNDRETAIKKFQDSNFDIYPDKLIIFCSRCKTIHSIEKLDSSGRITKLSKEKIINV